MTATASLTTDQPTSSAQDLNALIEQIVDTFPPLTNEQKSDLGHLLAPSTGAATA